MELSAGPTFDYSGTAGAAYHSRRQLPPAAEEWICAIRAEKFQPWIKPGDRVFEYGVGFGWNLARLQCAEKAGCDVAPGLQTVVEGKGIRFVADPAALPGATFDVVICHHTLEHLRHPAGALAIIRNLLKPGGTLLLHVPYEKERKYRRHNPADKAGHLYSWTPSSLSNLVISEGYELLAAGLQRFRFDRAAAVVALKLKIGEPGYRFLRRAGQLLLPEYEIALVAQKPRLTNEG